MTLPFFTSEQSCHASQTDGAAGANRLLAIYRQRDRLLGAQLFASPGWDILLELRAAGRCLSADELHDRIATSAEALARWMAVLQAEGLISIATGTGEAVCTLTGRAIDGLDALLADCPG